MRGHHDFWDSPRPFRKTTKVLEVLLGERVTESWADGLSGSSSVRYLVSSGRWTRTAEGPDAILLIVDVDVVDDGMR